MDHRAPVIVAVAAALTGLGGGAVAVAAKQHAPPWQGTYANSASAAADYASFIGFNPGRPTAKVRSATMVLHKIPFTCDDGATEELPFHLTHDLVVNGSAWKVTPLTQAAITLAASGKFVKKASGKRYADGTLTVTGVTHEGAACQGSLTFHLGLRSK